MVFLSFDEGWSLAKGDETSRAVVVVQTSDWSKECGYWRDSECQQAERVGLGLVDAETDEERRETSGSVRARACALEKQTRSTHPQTLSKSFINRARAPISCSRASSDQVHTSGHICNTQNNLLQSSHSTSQDLQLINQSGSPDGPIAH